MTVDHDEIKKEKERSDESTRNIKDDIQVRGPLKGVARVDKSRAYLQNLFKEIGKDKILLDVGCGNGLFTVPLANIFRLIVGVDISEKMMKRCKEKRSNLDFVMASSTNLPFRDQKFDCVLALSLLQHLGTRENVKKTLKELSRTTTDQSFMFLAFWDTPNSPTSLVKNILKEEKYKLKQSLVSRLHITRYVKLQAEKSRA